MQVIPLPQVATHVDVPMWLPEQQPPLHGCCASHAVPHCWLWQAMFAGH
jgi:hypothetical protein